MSYRVAAVSDDLAADFGLAARLAAELGLDGVSVRHIGGRNIAVLDEPELRAVRRQADDHGLAISAVASPYGRGFFLGDRAAREDAEALLRRMIRAAELLGTTHIRVFACWIPGQDAIDTWTRRPDPGEYSEAVVAALAPSVRLAERAGVDLMFELEGASYAGQVREFRTLWQRLASPAVTFCWDVCNGWWSGEAPWPDGWAAAEGLPIVDVQTKDVRAAGHDPAAPTHTQVVLGEGDLPYRPIVSALLASGYEGWFTAERVYHPRAPEHEPALRRDIVADVRRLRALLAAPGA